MDAHCLVDVPNLDVNELGHSQSILPVVPACAQFSYTKIVPRWRANRLTLLSGFMPRKKLIILTFESEAEEADWWERHRASVEADLRAPIREGKSSWLQEVLAEVRRKKGLPGQPSG